MRAHQMLFRNRQEPLIDLRIILCVMSKRIKRNESP